MSLVLYERHDHVGLITLNNPSRLNALGTPLLNDFNSTLDSAIDDPDISVIVLTGSGRAFCAGDDLQEFDWDNVSEDAVRTHIEAIQAVTNRLMGCDKPVVGAIHGYAVGGGFEWLLNCDLVVAADNLIAFFPEMDWGFFVTGGVTHLLPQAIGHQKGTELLLLGERRTADGRHRLGLGNWGVRRDDMLSKAMEVAAQIATKSRPSVARLKTMLSKDLAPGLWKAVKLEEQATIDAFLRPDSKERAQRFTAQREAKKSASSSS